MACSQITGSNRSIDADSNGRGSGCSRAKTCRSTPTSGAPGTGHWNVPEISMRRCRGERFNVFR
jgi:hypothetical protein